MTYQDAVRYLESLVNYERRHDPQAMREVKLARMRRLCQRLGDPQRRFRSVLVTGTNGKGSICALLYSMLRESSLRAGLYTSPHIEHLRERIRAWTRGPQAERAHQDDWISEAECASAIERVAACADAMREESFGAPTYFEVMTAAALLHFSRIGVDVAVLEVGLGGRLDATNVVDQAISVIGPIDVDHTDVLGDDPVKIAYEKSGVIKANQVVLSARQQEPVLHALRTVCEAQGVPLTICGSDLGITIHESSLEGLRVSITGLRGRYESLPMPLIGRHQASNAALAIAALEALSDTGVPYGLVERGLLNAQWPGRLEVVSDVPLVFIDGAHNPHAARALRDTLEELCQGRTVHLLMGMSADKSIEEVGKLLGRMAVSVTCTKSRHPRALDPTELAKRLYPFCHDVHVMSDPIDAYTYLLNAVSSQDVIVVTGSLFLAGELRAALRQAHVRSRRLPEFEPLVA